jgi:guanylate kinase
MKGKLFLIVGPSGSGKSSVLHGLMKKNPDYIYPLSATTRPMRKGEKDGDIYRFYTKERFEEGIKNDEFLEYAIVHQDNYYGLLKKPVMDGLKNNETIVREVDIQGFDSMRKAIPKKNLVTIFITVPDKKELIERIINRAAISEDELNKRRESMHREFNRAKDCDYIIENKNGELENTIQKVADIIKSETCLPAGKAK